MKRQPFAPVGHAGIERYRPGEQIPNPEAGDFILTRDNAWQARLIRFGQALRIHGADRKYTYWNHAALVVDREGTIIEALGSGVTRNNISKYKPKDYHYVRIEASEADREEVVKFGEWCLGQPYDFLTIASIIYSLLTGGKFTFGFDGHCICSGLVARALERTTAIFNRTPSHIMPADLAKYFQVEPPSK